MQIQAAIFDIDGTLVPVGESEPSPRTLAALRALQARGVSVIIATGRALFAAKALLGSFVPDYYVCACGAYVCTGDGRVLEQRAVTPEEMYALVDFFEDYDCPLCFTFPDAYYAYVGFETLNALYAPFQGTRQFMCDGEDQVRHLQGMPQGAAGSITAERRVQFAEKYGHLGLRFLPFHEDFCDILCSGVDKAHAVGRLLDRLGVSWEHAAAFGDGANDAQLLAEAGLSVAMGNGAESLRAAAHIVAPHTAQDGVAAVIEEHLL